jgi:hypothetical protein
VECSTNEDCPSGNECDPWRWSCVDTPIDAVTWEGAVTVGPYADHFAFLNTPNIGTDVGNGVWIDGSGFGKPKVYSCPGRSLANLSSDLGRAVDPNDWVATSSQGDPYSVADDVCTMETTQPSGYGVPAHTPGGPNPTQNLTCSIIPQVCGDGTVQYGEDCEPPLDPNTPVCETYPDGFICAPPRDPAECTCVPSPGCGNEKVEPGEECDEGDANSNDPDATCREDCKMAGCWDGIIDPAFGEDCVTDEDCSGSDVCIDCECGGPAMGPLNFTVIPGPSDMDACDSQESLLSTDGNPTEEPGGAFVGLVCNGTQGDFTEGPLVLFAGRRDAVTGIAPLRLDTPVVIKAHLSDQKPGCGGECVACWRFEQDPINDGFVACDGGRSANVVLQIDSNADSAPVPPSYDPIWLAVDTSGNQGDGTAVVRVIMKNVSRNGTGLCPNVNDPFWTTSPGRETVLVTGQARTTIDDPLVCPGELGGVGCPNANPYQVIMTGANFDCDNWTSDSGAKLVTPVANLNESMGPTLGEGDIAQVLKLADN